MNLVSLITGLLLLGAPNEKVLVEKIEARVGQEIITSTDIDLAVANLRVQALEKKTDKTLEKKALDDLIDAALIRDYLSRMDMQVTDQEIDRRINTIRTSNGISSLSEFKAMLEMQGMSFNRYRAQVRQQMEISKFDSVVQRQQFQTLDEKEMRSYYDRNSAQFQKNYQIRLKECVLVSDGSDLGATQKLAKRYTEKPRRFDECVEKHSQSPSKARQGDLGTVTRGILRDDIEKKVFSAKKGEVVAIANPRMIQLLKVTERVDLGPRSFDDMRTDIKRLIEGDRLSQARRQTLDELRSSTFIRLGS